MITKSWQLSPRGAVRVEIVAPSRVLISADGVFYLSSGTVFVWAEGARLDGTLGPVQLPGVIREPFMIYGAPGGSEVINVSVVVTEEAG